MTWKIEILSPCKKQLHKLDKPIQKRVLGFLYNRVLPANNPRFFGKALTGKYTGLWSYRVGDYRIIADIQDERLVIVTVGIDHRRQVYDE